MISNFFPCFGQKSQNIILDYGEIKTFLKLLVRDARRSPKKILHLIGVGLKYAVSFPFLSKIKNNTNHNSRPYFFSLCQFLSSNAISAPPPRWRSGYVPLARAPTHCPSLVQVLTCIMISKKTTGPVWILLRQKEYRSKNWRDCTIKKTCEI